MWIGPFDSKIGTFSLRLLLNKSYGPALRGTSSSIMAPSAGWPVPRAGCPRHGFHGMRKPDSRLSAVSMPQPMQKAHFLAARSREKSGLTRKALGWRSFGWFFSNRRGRVFRGDCFFRHGRTQHRPCRHPGHPPEILTSPPPLPGRTGLKNPLNRGRPEAYFFQNCT